MLRFIGLVFVILNYVGIIASVSVTTKLGVINGKYADVEFDGISYTVQRFLGIPFAQPPVGDLRFQRPQPVAAFDEPFDAYTDGAICPQMEFEFFPPITAFGMSEDCLYLNIFVPEQKPDQPSGHAVLFFIHGGGFTLGSGSWFRGDTLASVGNVIVVTINYRIGLLGFLDMDDERAAGNVGFFDQRQALIWVNENIEAFGGDKNRVVIFGESAGAASVSLQMLYPDNEGLFYGVIAESGAPFMPTLYEPNSINAGKVYAQQLNCSAETTDEILDCLYAAKDDDFINAYKNAMDSKDYVTVMQMATFPSVDGEFLKSKPMELFKKAKTETVKEVEFCRKIKLINGMNSNEGAFFVIMQNMATMDDLVVTRESMNAQLPGISALVFGQTPVPEVVTKKLLSEYTDWSNPDDPVKLRDQLARCYGDVYFNVPGIGFSREHANSSSSESYLYQYNAFIEQTPLPRPKWQKGAVHGEELVTVFGYDADKSLWNISSDFTPPPWERDLSTRMMTYWSNFAKTGNPNEPSQSSRPFLKWPQYKIGTEEYIIIDQEDSTGEFLYAREVDFWTNIIPAVMKAAEHPETVSTGTEKVEKETCERDGDCDGE